DHALGDDVAAHDAAENIHQDGLDAAVLQHDLEGFRDLLGRRTTAHVQEVGGFATEQLDGVHGRHGQARAIDQAADVAVELNIGQVIFAGLDFRRVFFLQVAVGNDIGVAEQRIRVEIELGVQRLDVAIALEDQRVD